MAYADLEISLYRRGVEDSYEIELRYNDSSALGELRLEIPQVVRFDRDALRNQEIDPAQYGRTLSDALFEGEMLDRFKEARQRAQAFNCPLHLRLRVTRKVAHLHHLRWETLRDPCEPHDDALTTNQNVLFSRYLDSRAYRAARPRRATQPLRVLVTVAAPNDLQRYQTGGRPLDPIRTDEVLEQLKPALGDCQPEGLTEPGEATLEKLASQTNAGCDILYLVCHGGWLMEEACLWLVGDDNQAHVVRASELVARIKEWRSLPYVVVLASCQSAGKDAAADRTEFEVLSAIGPQLAEAGVPAVLAMQGNVTMNTVRDFMPEFFKVLRQEGSVDLAVSAARGRVRANADCWRPALFSRMRSGQLWYSPGLQTAEYRLTAAPAAPEPFRPWDGLLANIDRGECTAVLGFGLLEHLIGSREEIAGAWAERYGYPLTLAERDDLTQMAQFLAVDQNQTVPGDQFCRYLREELLDRLGSAPHDQPHPTDLNDLLQALADRRRQPGVADVHAILARLPIRLYLTTSPDTLLETALGRNVPPRTPQVESFEWRPGEVGRAPPPKIDMEQPPQGLPASPGDLKPTVGRPLANQPLVYHLFGSLQDPDSLLLTEDNYFDYLLAMTRAQKSRDIPQSVRGALAGSALLFLGFHMTDWDFRVLLRSIQALFGVRPRGRYTNVAVQIDPQHDRVTDVGTARRYLEKMLGNTSGVEVTYYWGNVETFLRELDGRFEARQRLQGHR